MHTVSTKVWMEVTLQRSNIFRLAAHISEFLTFTQAMHEPDL